jgi:predicted ArsR family transcriptional regulator
VKETAIEIIKEKGFVREIDIYRKTKFSRTAIRPHLKKLVSEGLGA